MSQRTFHENETFSDTDFSNNDLSYSEFDSCNFTSCNFSNSNLAETDFTDCKFENCNFSLVRLKNTGLKNVNFIACKLLGMDFTKCKDFLISFCFENCILDYSIFQKKKIHKTTFKDCSVKEVDFSLADLTASGFLNCDLTRTTFQHTILDKVDFRSAYNFYIDPEINRLTKAKFSSSGIVGLLAKYRIIIE